MLKNFPQQAIFELQESTSLNLTQLQPKTNQQSTTFMSHSTYLHSAPCHADPRHAQRDDGDDHLQVHPRFPLLPPLISTERESCGPHLLLHSPSFPPPPVCLGPVGEEEERVVSIMQIFRGNQS